MPHHWDSFIVFLFCGAVIIVASYMEGRANVAKSRDIRGWFGITPSNIVIGVFGFIMVKAIYNGGFN